MPSVGTAYVNIRVNTTGFEASLDSLMKRLSTKMEAQGTKLGKDFERGVKKANFDSAFQPAVNAADKAQRSMSDSAKKSSDAWDDSAQNIGESAREISNAMGDASGAATHASRDMKEASGSARRLSGSMRGMGDGGGGLRRAGGDAGFFSSKLNELVSEAPRGTALLNSLFQTAAFGGTALAGAVGGLSAVAQGVFAVGANAAAATPALGGLINAVIGLAQVGGVAALATSGVGKALTAGFKAVDTSAKAAGKSSGGMAKATKAASTAVRDAKQNLTRAYQDAARAAADATRRVQEAERSLAAAQRDSAVAQRALNAARLEGLQQLKEIGFAAEDAALAEDRAALALGDAQAELASVSELAPDDRMRVEAELAFKEADLNMRQAINRREQADKDQKKAAKSGVEGTDAMIDAHNAVADAQEAEADAARDLADARRQQAETAQDNARRIADAQQALADAMRGMADVQRGVNAEVAKAPAAITNFATAMDKLGPAQRRFVNKILGMQDEFNDFRNDVTAPLFNKLITAIDIVAKGPLVGTLRTGLTGTASALGDVAINAANVASTPLFNARLGRVMATNNDAIRIFGRAGGNMADVLLAIADAARPLVLHFARWTENVTASWRATRNSEEGTRKLAETMKNAETRIREFWGLTKQLWRTLMILGRAANDAANGFGEIDKKSGKAKGYIPTLTDSLTKFNDKLEKNPTLVGRFTAALENMSAAGRAIKTVFQPFIDLGSNPQIGQAFDTISKSDAFDRLGDSAGGAVPKLATVVVNLADFLADISESKAIEHFLDILIQVTDKLADFSGFLKDTGILKWTGYITGAMAAMKLLWAVTKIGTSPFVRMSQGFGTFMSNISKAKKSGKGLGASIFGSIGKGPTSAGGAVAGSADDAKMMSVIESSAGRIVLAIEACCTKMTLAIERMALGGAGGAAGAAGRGGGILSAAPKVGSGAAGAVGAASGVGAIAGDTAKVGKFAGVAGKLGKALGPATKLMKPLSLGIRGIGAAMRFAMGPWGMLIMVLLPLMWPLLVKLEEKTGIFSSALEILTDTVSWLWEHALEPMFNWIADVAIQIWEDIVSTFEDSKGVLSAVGDAFGWLWDKIVDVFNWVKTNWPTLLAILTGPIGIAVLLITRNWETIKGIVSGAVGAIKGFLGGMWTRLTTGLSNAWSWVLQKWEAIKAVVKGWGRQLGAKIGNIWGKFTSSLSSAWNWIGRKWTGIKDAVGRWKDQLAKKIGNIWSKFTSALGDAWAAVGRTWARIKNAVVYWKGQLSGKIGNIWSKFTSALGDAWNAVKRKWKDIKDTVALWPRQLGSKLSGIWGGLTSGLHSAYDTMRGVVNNKLIGGINNILGKLHLRGISVSMPAWSKMAEGGPVRGPGGPKADRIPTLLSNGEYVLPAHAVRGVGYRALEEMRRTGKLPAGDGAGIFSSIGNAFHSITDVFKKGVKAAMSWVTNKTTKSLNNSIMGRLAYGMVKLAAGRLNDWGAARDRARAAARARAAGASVVVNDPSNPAAISIWGGHKFSNRFIAHLKKAQQLAHTTMHIMQGGWNPGGVAASGTSHWGDAIDIAVNYALLRALRRVGIAAGDRTGKGPWGPHIHAVPGPAAGYGRGSAPGQWASYMAMGGASQSPTSAWGLAKGGVVAPSPTGTLALIAEAGQHERVTPLDAQGFTPAERQMLETLEARLGGGGDTYNVHPSRGMNEAQLADMVARRVSWNRRRGAGT
jgi:phage-related protein